MIIKDKKEKVVEDDTDIEIQNEVEDEELDEHKEELLVDENEDMEEFVDYSVENDGESSSNEDKDAVKEKYVVGYSIDEPEMSEMASRDNYTNWEVNEYLDNYFRFFGKKDMDIIYLYFLSGKKQEDLVKIFGKTQPAISYDVTRIKEQIQFVVKMEASIDDFVMFIVDDNNQLNTYDREMLTLFFYSTSIVKTSRLMGVGNITCRSHLNTIVNRLLANGYVDMYNLFKYIMNNLNNVKKFVARGEDE